MKITSFHIGCLILTCVVVHTCVRIEILNARYGYYLPRTDFGSGNPKWRVAADSLARRDFERSIAMERQAKFAEEHPGEPIPEHTEFIGPPYSASQQTELEAILDQNQRRSALYDWVRGMGLLQYALAPAALFWSVDIARIERSRSGRIAAGFAALLNLICIALMFYRGYFTSLGW